ncbi:hypothetical protein B481_2395 [Planococcus halocryophilus Or1]|nr:hypothetical protein B481_2395 [Planococcus halocryophilus Or1]
MEAEAEPTESEVASLVGDYKSLFILVKLCLYSEIKEEIP